MGDGTWCRAPSAESRYDYAAVISASVRVYIRRIMLRLIPAMRLLFRAILSLRDKAVLVLIVVLPRLACAFGGGGITVRERDESTAASDGVHLCVGCTPAPLRRLRLVPRELGYTRRRLLLSKPAVLLNCASNMTIGGRDALFVVHFFFFSVGCFGRKRGLNPLGRL